MTVDDFKVGDLVVWTCAAPRADYVVGQQVLGIVMKVIERGGPRDSVYYIKWTDEPAPLRYYGSQFNSSVKKVS